MGDLDPVVYKRWDSETLKAQVAMPDWSLTAMYLWCTASEEGNGWRLAEIVPYDMDLARDGSWSATIAEANARAPTQHAPAAATASTQRWNGGRLSVTGQGDDDDDYWAQYDRSPSSRTPARKASIQPSGLGVINGGSEDDYYARYGDVQPAADNYDPDEHHEDPDRSQHIASEQNSRDIPVSAPAQHLNVDTSSEPPPRHESPTVVQPVPSSPGSSTGGSDMVAKLERTAEKYSSSEIAIKQHIGYSVKSMYRLAKGAGISRREFEDMVHRELETLSMLDRDD